MMVKPSCISISNATQWDTQWDYIEDLCPEYFQCLRRSPVEQLRDVVPQALQPRLVALCRPATGEQRQHERQNGNRGELLHRAQEAR